jgi:hypothetical protein
MPAAKQKQWPHLGTNSAGSLSVSNMVRPTEYTHANSLGFGGHCAPIMCIGSGKAQLVGTLWQTTTAERVERYLTGMDCRYSSSVRSAADTSTRRPHTSDRAQSCQLQAVCCVVERLRPINMHVHIIVTVMMT